jgi:hypothetical protein
MRNNKGQFTAGNPDRSVPIGTVRIRTRHKRSGEQRAFIKIAEPNVWILRARHIWEQARGPIPRGMGIHHKDRNKLNDDLGNLELVSKAEHIDEHRDEYRDKTTAALVAARKERRWSTKSDTKRTGRPPTYSEESLQAAIAAYQRGEGTKAELERRFDLPSRTLVRKM